MKISRRKKEQRDVRRRTKCEKTGKTGDGKEIEANEKDMKSKGGLLEILLAKLRSSSK